MPKISVLLPVYNCEKYISEAILSILTQTYNDYEFIILNDGSTDLTVEIIKSFTDPRIRIIDKQQTGLVDTLNYGIKISCGELIARMDADDIALPNRFEWQVKRFNSDMAVLGGQFNILTNNKLKRAKHLPLKHKDIINNFIKRKPSIVHSCTMLNKNLLLKVGMYDEKLMLSEDYDLWLRLSHLGKLENLPQVILNLRKHASNISVTRTDEQIIISFIVLFYYVHYKQHTKITDKIFIKARKIIEEMLNEEKFLDLNRDFLIDKELFLDKSIIGKTIFVLKKPEFVKNYFKLNKKRKTLPVHIASWPHLTKSDSTYRH